MSASGSVHGLPGLAGAYQINDPSVTGNQFFNGFALLALPPLPPSTGSASPGLISTVVIAGQLRGLPSPEDVNSGLNGEAGASGLEVSISAHNVDWDEPVADLPIKPEDYLLDLDEFFSGRRAQGGTSEGSRGPSRNEAQGACDPLKETCR